MTNTRFAVERSVLGGLLTFPKVWDDLQLVADYFGDALNNYNFFSRLNAFELLIINETTDSTFKKGNKKFRGKSSL